MKVMTNTKTESETILNEDTLFLQNVEQGDIDDDIDKVWGYIGYLLDKDGDILQEVLCNSRKKNYSKKQLGGSTQKIGKVDGNLLFSRNTDAPVVKDAKKRKEQRNKSRSSADRARTRQERLAGLSDVQFEAEGFFGLRPKTGEEQRKKYAKKTRNKIRELDDDEWTRENVYNYFPQKKLADRVVDAAKAAVNAASSYGERRSREYRVRRAAEGYGRATESKPKEEIPVTCGTYETSEIVKYLFDYHAREKLIDKVKWDLDADPFDKFSKDKNLEKLEKKIKNYTKNNLHHYEILHGEDLNIFEKCIKKYRRNYKIDNIKFSENDIDVFDKIIDLSLIHISEPTRH